MRDALTATLALTRGDFTLDVELACPPGITCIMGPSGSGKSTILASIAGLALLPYGILTPLEHFLEPAFADSRFGEDLHPSDTLTTVGLLVGATAGILGILLAYTIWVRRPGTSARLIERFPAVHRLLANKWYWDEIYDYAIVRPIMAFGRFGRTVFESAVIQGVFVGGASRLVLAGTSFARAIQSGYLRAYALLLLIGMFALALYFLIVSS